MDIRLYISGKVQSSKLFLKEVLKKEGIKNYVVKLNKYGKPYIKDINFNLSHNNQYIVCVVSKEPIGIDIEIVTDKLQRIRDSLLNKEELKKYKTDKQLTKVWTIKEAIVKLIGMGINKKMNLIAINDEKYFYKSFFINNNYLTIASFQSINKVIKYYL